MSNLVIGTAGHIDHGKTSLVRALTGIDTDRLKEEKERGITIELGFAHLDLPGLDPVGIVDVPGHEKFVHHMVAGVAGIDLVVLVIAADEGVMPQTREHLDICRLLGVSRGIVVLTKKDLAEEDWIELVTDDVATLVEGSFLEGSPVIAVSSTTGEGMEDLKSAMTEALSAIKSRPASGLPRLPIDRVFTMKGFGTVATGTLVSGSLRTGDTVALLPGDERYRIRGLQVHGASVDKAAAGQRTAVNLQGAEKSSLARGDVITAPDTIEPTYLIDARLLLLKSSPRPLVNRARVRLHLGTSEILARAVVLGREQLEPGEEGMVQFRLESPGVALPRDRFVIRSYSPMVTLGGGVLIDTHPAKHKKFSREAVASLEILAGEDLAGSAMLLLREAGPAGMESAALASRLNIEKEDAHGVLDGLSRTGEALRVPGKPPLFLHGGVFGELSERCLDILKSFHTNEPLKAGISKEELRSRLRPLHQRAFPVLLEHLEKDKKVVLEKDLARLASHKVTLRSDQAEVRRKVEDYYRAVGLKPPVLASIGQELSLSPRELRETIGLLQEEGLLVKVSEELYLHRDRIVPLRQKLVDYLEANGKIDMQGFKEVSGLSRKYTIPIMEYFDRSGVTIRVEDHRVLRRT